MFFSPPGSRNCSIWRSFVPRPGNWKSSSMDTVDDDPPTYKLLIGHVWSIEKAVWTGMTMYHWYLQSIVFEVDSKPCHLQEDSADSNPGTWSFDPRKILTPQLTPQLSGVLRCAKWCCLPLSAFKNQKNRQLNPIDLQLWPFTSYKYL